MQVEKLLLTYQPTMLFVEHDTRFREKIETKTIRLWNIKKVIVVGKLWFNAVIYDRGFEYIGPHETRLHSCQHVTVRKAVHDKHLLFKYLSTA